MGAEEALRAIEGQEEALLALSPAEQKLFYERSQAAFKDPDVYTTLAYLFIAGLHHFYLKRWKRGLVDLGLNALGLLLLVLAFGFANWFLGIAAAVLWLGVAATELLHMARAQHTVRAYNLEEQRKILQALRG